MIGQLAAIEVRIMNQHTSLPPLRRQRGVVMIVLGVMLVVLIGFAGLAIDLGRTYLVRTELQNAADAAALAGAKQLNQTATGVSSAVTYATAMAEQHTFNFGKTVTSANVALLEITFGKCPEEVGCGWVSQAVAQADPVGRNFIKVDIRSRGLATFFAGVLGAATTDTFGLAVAGYSLVNLTPFGICAIDPNKPTDTTTTGELVEYGFRRGVSYNVLDLSPLAPGVHYLINPVDKYVTGASGECSPDNSSPDAVAPFVCSGTSAAIPGAAPGKVYGDSGYSAGKIQAALNSRFNVYGPPYACPVAEAPPDKNIRPYYPKYDGSKEFKPPKDWPTTTPVDWIIPDPNRQTMNLTAISSAPDYGVLWSYSRAVKADGTDFAATATDWNALYPVAAASAPAPAASYPATSPYLRDMSAIPPPRPEAQADRRVLDLAIVECPAGKGGVCTPIEVKAIGRFFMQVPAQIPARLDVEFAGTIKPPSVEIKLYR